MKSGVRKALRPGAYRHVAGRDPALVLIVDDYDHTREMYAEFLEFAGFRVAEAGTGTHAIKTVHERQPSLVVMDLCLPDMNGWQAANILRRDARTVDIPIIALTAYSRTHARDVALRAGCDVFLEKPIAPNALAEQITGLLRRRNGRAT
ncbi:MAG: transcriptional regulator [Labilithrix sp.]|nr:transcriptional regulator [Labilithrix sp.]